MLSSVSLQVAHHYPTIQHLTQIHHHGWLPKRVGKFRNFLCISLHIFRVVLNAVYRLNKVGMVQPKLKVIMYGKNIKYPNLQASHEENHTHVRTNAT